MPLSRLKIKESQSMLDSNNWSFYFFLEKYCWFYNAPQRVNKAKHPIIYFFLCSQKKFVLKATGSSLIMCSAWFIFDNLVKHFLNFYKENFDGRINDPLTVFVAFVKIIHQLLLTWKLSSINFFDSGSKKPNPGTGTSDIFTFKEFLKCPKRYSQKLHECFVFCRKCLLWQL